MVIRFDSLFASLTRLVYLAVVAVPFLAYVELPHEVGDYFPSWKVKAVFVLWLFLEFVVVRYETPWQFCKDIIGGPVGAASWVMALLAPTIGGYFWGHDGTRHWRADWQGQLDPVLGRYFLAGSPPN